MTTIRSIRCQRLYKAVAVAVLGIVLESSVLSVLAKSPWPEYMAGDLKIGIPHPNKADGISAGGTRVGAIGTFLIVFVLVENTSNVGHSLDLMSFELTDNRGQIYWPDPKAMDVYFQLKGWSGSPDSQVIPSHFQRRLAVIFDVSAGDHDFQILIPGLPDPVTLNVL